MAFPIRTQRTGNISTKHIYLLSTHVDKEVSMQGNSNETQSYRQESNHGTGTKTQAKKSHTTEYCYNVQLLTQFYLSDGASACIQKQRNGHPQRRGWQTGSVDPMWHGAGMTERAHETDASYPHPRGATMGRSRRLVPTATSVATPDIGPCNGGQVVTPSPHGH